MAKRKDSPVKLPHAQPDKRPRVNEAANGTSRPPRTKLVNVTTASQLERLLQYHHESVEQLVTNHKSVRKFLVAIHTPDHVSDDLDRVAILTNFLEIQSSEYLRKLTSLKNAGDQPSQDVERPNLLPDLFQTWTYSAASFHDQLFSVATSILHHLLKVVSSSLDLRRFGQYLCRSVLQYDHVKVISRVLASPPHKKHLSAPCLQLMTEIVSFDGGSFAGQVYLKKDVLIDPVALGRNLNSVNRSQDDDGTMSPRPSVRFYAVEYLSANLKFQREDAKSELIRQGAIMRSLFDYLADDPADLIVSTLDVIRIHVLRDRKVVRSSKAFMLTDKALSHAARILGIEQSQQPGSRTPQDAAYDFLRQACTSVQEGTLYDSNGWYNQGRDDQQQDDGGQSLLSLSVVGVNSSLTIRNTKIASFLQTMRPWTNHHQQKLMVSIFDCCPELVADYFPRMTNFSFDPKVTSTWIGYASFVFSVIKLPIPEFFGRRKAYDRQPPPTEVVLENLIPAVLDGKVLARCLNHSEDLISLFAVRLLVVSMQKLGSILTMYRKAAQCMTSSSEAWSSAGLTLVSRFCERCAPIKDAMALFFRVAEDNVVQREAVLRLLALYHSVVPELAFEGNFDVSKPLVKALQEILENMGSGSRQEMQLLELQHLLQIARHSTSMKWWHKPDVLPYTPFVALLHILTSEAPSASLKDQIQQLVLAISDEFGILESHTRQKSLIGLIHSLHVPEPHQIGLDPAFTFIDNCIGRLVRRPIKYADDMAIILARSRSQHTDDPASDAKLISPLWLVIAEQLPFITASSTSNQVAARITEWVARYGALSISAGENPGALNELLRGYKSSCDGIPEPLLPDNCSFEVAADLAPSQWTTASHNSTEDAGHTLTTRPATLRAKPGEKSGELTDDLTRTAYAFDDPPSHRILEKDPEETIKATQEIQNLLLSLSSADQSLRLSSLALMQNFAARLLSHSQTYLETPYLHLLLMEVLETVYPTIREDPLPAIASVFAMKAFNVLQDPTHGMFPKVCRFLNRAPSWNVVGLPSYWSKHLLLAVPGEDENGARTREIDWFLSWIATGLRDNNDFDILRLSTTIPLVLGWYASPNATASQQVMVLEIVLRACRVQGGRASMEKRFGVRSWMQRFAGMKGVDGTSTNREKHQSLVEELTALLAP